MSKIKVLVVPSNRDWMGQNRSIKPHLYLEKKYPEEFFVDIDFEPELDNDKWVQQYDIVHYQDKLGTQVETQANIERLIGLGVIPVLDVNEYWLPHSNHPAHKLYKSRGIDKMLLDNIKSANFITTSNGWLGREIKKYNPNVVVIPTGINPLDKFVNPKVSDTGRLKIGWVGSPNSIADLEPLKGFVGKLRSDKLLDKVQFVLGGFDLNDRTAFWNKETGEMDYRALLPTETAWYQFEKILTDDYRSLSSGYKKYLTRFENVPYEGDINNEPYRRLWSNMDSEEYYKYFDVSMIPMNDNTFNRCQEPVQLLKSAYQGKAVIAQDFGIYNQYLRSAYERGGELDSSATGFLVSPKHNHKDWYKYIKKMIQNPEIVKSIGNNLNGLLGDKFLIDSTSENRRNLYKGLLVDNKYNSFVE